MFGVPDEIRVELQIRKRAQDAVAEWVVQMMGAKLTEEQLTKGAAVLARVVVASLREVNALTPIQAAATE